MQSDWASQNLQVIRTLMERSAIYRRALAPLMTTAGVVGIGAATFACFWKRPDDRSFAGLWMGAGVVVMLAAFGWVRRQAVRDSEGVWSPPTRRVAEALCPNFLVGLAAGLAVLLGLAPGAGWMLPPVWLCSYGAALHAAGFFMRRGIRLFGWLMIVAGLGCAVAAWYRPAWRDVEAAHEIMGIFFGAAHLAYGIYLYFTEPRKSTT